MNQSTKDQVEGKVHEVKGAIKEKIGKVAHKPVLADDGKAEKVAGQVQKKVGQIERVLEK